MTKREDSYTVTSGEKTNKKIRAQRRTRSITQSVKKKSNIKKKKKKKKKRA